MRKSRVRLLQINIIGAAVLCGALSAFAEEQAREENKQQIYTAQMAKYPTLSREFREEIEANAPEAEALTGMRVPADELLRLGIVEAVTAPDDLLPAALEIAHLIASKSPVSTRMGKHTLNVIEDMSLRDGYRYEQDQTATIAKTEDAKEAQAAFREKRKPVFKGR